MLNDIHNNWKSAEVVRIKCLGVPTVDMQNVCTQLEVAHLAYACACYYTEGSHEVYVTVIFCVVYFPGTGCVNLSTIVLIC